MGEDFENSTQTYLIVLDRNSKKSTVDVDLSYLGGCMNISRHHARILYDSRAATSTSRSSARTAASISSRGAAPPRHTSGQARLPRPAANRRQGVLLPPPHAQHPQQPDLLALFATAVVKEGQEEGREGYGFGWWCGALRRRKKECVRETILMLMSEKIYTELEKAQAEGFTKLDICGQQGKLLG
ncbi:hypothetical protein RHMOL_Rhmol05G0293800 [Rhododendron molle]|uniref:Uncharacterized protein n=1 Tax=Rhododendron molle TaxID=49168 RepID=A0ACC0NWM0_RHOML|nr:hypothetical protein RHMOL_Rhmol05G0293800 [Rhododendron molle]